MNNEHEQENLGETKCTCDGSEEVWTKDGTWFLFWEVCHLHKTRRYSGSSNLFALPGARELNWESIADYSDVDPDATDSALATIRAILESVNLSRERNGETVKKAVEAALFAHDQMRKLDVDNLHTTRIFAATVCDYLSDKPHE